ncbi:MAG: hypothetical protein ACP5HG_13645 [Anaerolineae bacterium]
MDLFEAYPGLTKEDNEVLGGRSLRLIALAGFVYDETSLYCELGAPRYWARMADGSAAIGVGAPKVQPDGTSPLHRALIRHIRRTWRCSVELKPAGHSHLLDAEGEIHVLTKVAAHVPYLMVFTSPRLGGAEVPDALVQAVYLLPIRRMRIDLVSVSLLRISREALSRFLEPESWELEELSQKPWAELIATHPFPDDVRLRPVLALRGLRRMMQSGSLTDPFAV